MSTKKEECFVVCVHENSGFNEANFIQVRDAFIDAHSDYWEFLNPSTFLAFFLQRKNGQDRGKYLISKIEYLKNNLPSHSTVGYGSSLGKLIVPYSLFGKIKSSPLGTIVNDAMNMARKYSSSAVAG